jgi:peptidyl-tRNA hydrolase
MKKMYFLVKSTVPVGFAMNSVAHGSMMAMLEFSRQPIFEDWLKNSFRKVTCEVTPEEFEQAKTMGDHIVVTESALKGEETVLVFFPREDKLPFKLYKR